MSLPRSHTVFYHLIIFISSAFIRAKCQNTTECHNTDLGKSLVIITPQFPAVFCTGTLLNGKYVLTAAHCLLRTRLYVYAGLGEDSTNEEQMVKSEVQDYHVHSGYNRITMVNDVAVVHLKTHIDESDSIKYVHFRISTIPAYEWNSCKDGAFVMGLMQANASSTSGAIYCSSATVYPGTECAEVYKKGRFERDMCVLLDFRDLGCVGEPGGPVFCGDAQIGLISWGGCASGMLCKVWGMPTQKSKNVGLGVGKRLLKGMDDRLCAGGGCAKANMNNPKPFNGFPFAVVNVDKKINFMRQYAGEIRADAGVASLQTRFSWSIIAYNLVALIMLAKPVIA